MLRRTLTLILMCLFLAGFAQAGRAAASLAGCDHAAMLEAMPGDCGTDGMPMGACAVACATPCLVAHPLPQTALAAALEPPLATVSPPGLGERLAPDPAPPKSFRS